MTAWPTRVAAITLFVEDLPRSTLFYQDVFGLDVVYDDEDSVVFNVGNTRINLLKVPAARDLIAPGAVANQEAGSRFQLTIPVDNVDAACAELGRRGVTPLNGPMDRAWGLRTASFTDPAGNIWEISQKLSQPAGS